MKDNSRRRSTVRRLFLCMLPLMGLARPAVAQHPGSLSPPHMEWGTTSFVLLDQMEYTPGVTERPLSLDAVGWIGGAYNKLWFRVEGEQHTTESNGEGEAQLLYGRVIAPFWDALVGVRVDRRWGHEGGTRTHLAIGIEGLAPYWFEVAPTLFVSRNGEISARLEAEYELLLTQQLVLVPDVEVNAALQDVEEWGIGSGLTDYGLGLRLRYEIRSEFAPYVGWQWDRRLGGTAHLALAEGEPVSGGAFVAGLRLWY